MTASWTARTTCRACDWPLGESYLHLGDQPLANALLDRPSDPELVAPLAVALCTACGLSQLTVTVDPMVLYAKYPFRSGTTEAWRDHCKAFVQQCGGGGFVVDLAANDGAQLAAFAEAGWNTLGVEPSDVEGVKGIPCLRAFFGQPVAEQIVREYGKPSLIVAQNVVGHVDDPTEFLRSAAFMLAEGGQLVIEVPHVRDLIAQGAFDTIYHEHLNYWSTRPLLHCARSVGLTLDRMDRLSIHGGSRRYWFVHRYTSADEGLYEATDWRADERPYLQFARSTNAKLVRIAETLDGLRAQGKRLWAYGASAKGAVMLNALKARGNTVWPELIVDEARTKHGRFSPGLHLPIKPALALKALTHPDVLWLLSWNWADLLKARARAMGYEGQFLVTSPDVEVS